MNRKINLSQSFVTLGILIILVVVFLVEMFLGGSENVNVLMKMGAMNNFAVVAGHQWWRFVYSTISAYWGNAPCF